MIHNLWGHNRTLETIMLGAFNRSSLLKDKRTFVKLIGCYKLSFEVLITHPFGFLMSERPKIFFSDKACLWFLYMTQIFFTVGYFHDFKIDCNFHDCSDELAIHNLWAHWNFLLENLFNFHDLQHNQMIHNLWGHETLLTSKHVVFLMNVKMTNLFHFRYLQDDRTMHILWRLRSLNHWPLWLSMTERP